MTMAQYQIRRMSRQDLKRTIGWAGREGWNPGLHDLDPFHHIDPQGFLLGWIGDRPVASISCVRYSDRHAFLGFYIVDPALRGHGLGTTVWEAALEHARGCVVGLDGVVARQDNYRRSGFALAWNNQRYRCAGRGTGPCLLHPHVVPLSTLPFDVLAAYDRAFHPVPRDRFLQAWILQPQSLALAWLEEGELRGYGVMRACVDGHKLAPLCADTPAIADALMGALCSGVPPHESVWLDVPQAHPQVMAWARRQGLEASFPTARMYRGPAPRLDMARLYALTALEVG